MLRCRPVQALMFTHFCSGWCHFLHSPPKRVRMCDVGFISPLYLGCLLTSAVHLVCNWAMQRGSLLCHPSPVNPSSPVIDIIAVALTSVGIVISCIAGPMADALVARGWKTGLVRKLSQCIAFVAPSLCLIGASFSESNEIRVALLTASIGLGGFCLPGLYSNSQDLTPKYAGFLLSMTTTLAALPGIIGANQGGVFQRRRGILVGVSITGAILDATNSWPLALFLPAIVLMLLGAVVFGLYGRGHEIHFADNRPFAFEKHIPWNNVQKRN